MRLLLFRLISSLSILFTGCVIGASIMGHTQPPDALTQRLHLSDCHLPCWIGIIPGETRDTDAYQHFARTFGIGMSDLGSFSQYGFHTNFPLSDTQTMPIQFQVSQSIIDEIQMPDLFGNDTPIVPMPRLGDVVNLLGKPTCVDPRSAIFGGLSLLYETETGVVEVGLPGSNDLRWSQPIYFLSLRGNDLPFHVNGCTTADIRLPAWTGLASQQYYLRRQTAR